MRNALFILPVLAAALVTKPADACGPYSFGPQVLNLSTHFADGGTRTFIITKRRVADDQPWVRLAPMTYDYAGIVDVKDPETALDFTLVGPSGTKVISTKRQVNLSHTFVSRSSNVAFEIKPQKASYAIAVAGKHADAVWMSLGNERAASAAELAWVAAQGVTPMQAEYVHVNRLEGTDLETITVLPKTGDLVTFVRRGTVLHAQFTGSPMGALAVDGDRFVVGGKFGESPRTFQI